MKVAVIGTGGREHALAVKSLKSPHVDAVHVIPGNTGMLMTKGVTLWTGWDGDFASLKGYLRDHGIDLVIIGNEAYLAAGIVDYFVDSEITVFGPLQHAARLEYDKDFAKRFMHAHDIPTAAFTTCTTYEEAVSHMETLIGTLVIKQNCLALGKGVLVTDDRVEAERFLRESFEVTDTVVFERFLEGREFSLLAFVNHDYYNLMRPARDYKRAYDHDKGLNTGGMGAYTPVEYISDADLQHVEQTIVIPTVQGLLKEGIEFTGILYFGLMKTADSIEVIEYNTRFGDPEAEVLLESMDSDLIEVIAATMGKTPYPLRWKQGITLGVCMAATGYPKSYKKDLAVNIPESVPCFSMALRKEGAEFMSDGGRVAFIVASGETIEEAQRRCYTHVESVSCPDLFCRRDIGL